MTGCCVNGTAFDPGLVLPLPSLAQPGSAGSCLGHSLAAMSMAQLQLWPSLPEDHISG